jgi:Skp family chaperone for outer membrane proteins
VWWHDRQAFDAMLAAGARLKKAHLAWSGGGQADVRAAAEARRVAVRAVVDAALAALGDPKGVAPDMQYRISGTVEALASGAVPEAVPGRLTKDVQASGLEGLGALAEAAASASSRPQSRPRPTLVHSRSPGPSQVKKPAPGESPAPSRKVDTAKEAAAQRRAQELEKIEARLKDLEARLDAMTREAEERKAEAAQAKREADDAREEVSGLEEQLDRAREREKEARRIVVETSKAASETEMVRARTARDVAAAREQRERLQQG